MSGGEGMRSQLNSDDEGEDSFHYFFGIPS